VVDSTCARDCARLSGNMSKHCRCLHIAGALSLTFFVSCRESTEVVVTEQRELTMFDANRDSLVAVMPPEWRQLPGTQFRLFNYRFGEDGEIAVGRSRGDILSNINRWVVDQFGQTPLASTDNLQKVSVLGQQGVLVSAKGRFKGGMGKPARENAALLGMIVAVGDQLLTVKMIGDADAVFSEKDRLIKFCEKLRISTLRSEEIK